MKKLSLLIALSLLAPASASALPKVSFFQADGGNVGCVIARDGARCDIAKRKWSAPPKPAACPLDYGNGLAVDRKSKGHFTCAGDTVLGNGPMFEDGDVIRRGRFHCTVDGDAVNCTNIRDKHGFEISRQEPIRF